jgi:hypothetical protein
MWVQHAKCARWEACAEAALTKDVAMLKRKHWKHRNPTDRFRVAQYVAAKP